MLGDLLLIAAIFVADGADPFSRRGPLRAERLETIVDSSQIAASVRRQGRSSFIRREALREPVDSTSDLNVATAQLPLTIVVDKGGPARDHIVAVVSEPTTEALSTLATAVCEKSPCCPAPGCIFPFRYKGLTFSECTDMDESRFWCGKEFAMHASSEWDWCAPGLCAIVVNNSKEARVRDQKVVEAQPAHKVKDHEVIAKVDATEDVAVSQTRGNADFENATAFKPVVEGHVNGSTRKTETTAEVLKNASTNETDPFTGKVAMEAMKPARIKEAAALRNASSVDAQASRVVERADTDPNLVDGRVPSPREINQTDVLRKKTVTCPSPLHILHGNNMGCLEGQAIRAGQWCTPSCKLGKQPFIRLSGSRPKGACADSKGNWGYKLCCIDGVLHPATYTCVNEPFTEMDASKDGSISEEEFEGFQRSGAGANASKDVFKNVRHVIASKTLRTLEEIQSLSDEERGNETAEPNFGLEGHSFLFLYILGVTITIVLFTVVSVVCVIKQSLTPASHDSDAYLFRQTQSLASKQVPSNTKSLESKDTLTTPSHDAQEGTIAGVDSST